MRSARDFVFLISRIPLRRRRLEIFPFTDDYQNRRLSKGSGNGRYCAVPGARRVTRRRAALPGGAFPGRVRECEEVPQIARRCRGSF